MKIRTGFVSNSSTSSFLIAADDNGEDTKVKIQIEVDISRYADTVMRTKEEVDAYMIDRHCWGDMKTLEDVFQSDWCGESLKEEYEKMIDAVEKGKVVMAGGFSNEYSDAAELFLSCNGIPKDAEGVEIIYNEAGF